jgi:hypothetical protein
LQDLAALDAAGFARCLGTGRGAHRLVLRLEEADLAAARPGQLTDRLYLTAHAP